MLVWCILFFTIAVAVVHPNKTVNKKKSRKCKKQGIKDFLFLYYIQAKCGNIADKNPNAVDHNEQTCNYRWPDFTSGCLTISHIVCPVYPVNDCCSFGMTYLSLGGRCTGKDERVVSWEGGKAA